MVPSGKKREISGVFRLDCDGMAVENYSSNLNISKTGWAISAKFLGFAGLHGPYLLFGPELGKGSNFEKMALRIVGGSTSVGPCKIVHKEFVIFLRVLLAGSSGNMKRTFAKLHDGK